MSDTLHAIDTYIWRSFCYFFPIQARKDENQPTVVVIPTGGLGNATSACVAVQMGLPLRIACAVTNDALSRAVYDNDYSIGQLNVSLAPAMNIQV